ncbi:MAG: hypothetical protein COA52_09895 [Hyphomicrobiales bacterium]|nr:MAG: hypothetical protein COA52_09895 [Hyphomicrobiales bacterium]
MPVSTIVILCAAAAVAGLVRGFAGFGAAMVFMPIASYFVDPRLAAIGLWLMDSLPQIVILIPALRSIVWKTVIPAAVGFALTVNFGAQFLAQGDSLVLRWILSVTIIVVVAILWSGLRYHGKRPALLSAFVGSVSGFLSGAMQLAGPPVLVYWLSGSDNARTIRANLIAFFSVGTVLTGIGYWINGLFVPEAFGPALAATPLYIAGMLIGQRYFSKASEALYRRVAFVLILVVAAATLPIGSLFS